MRNELTFRALAREPNCFRLCMVVATAMRKLHRPNTRVQDTMNDTLVRLSGPRPRATAAAGEPASTQCVVLPEVAP
jgi:hypothetical protein